MTGKKWCVGFLTLSLAMLIAIGSFTAVVDPYFHYHAPLDSLEYPINNQRYQNDGIGKHFSYDAIITGSSMTENFRVSELNALFDVNAIKIPFSGAPFKEINDNLQRAIQANPEIKMVVRALDGYMLFEDKDTMRTDATYPDYLYDSNPLNDVAYLLNKEILFSGTIPVLDFTAEGNSTTDFDTYCSWENLYEFGPEAVLGQSGRAADAAKNALPSAPISEKAALTVSENVLQNVVSTAAENPDIQFYYYFPPYSIVWWDRNYASGQLHQQIQAYEIASALLLEYPNVHLFSFCDDYEIITELDNYKDQEHHSAAINSKILADMRAQVHQLTLETYEAYWANVFEFYNTFDYDAYFSGYMQPAEP